MKFISHWILELRGYSLAAILKGVYLTESPYPAPILDWAQTRKINGLIVSDLRKQVKVRLLAEQAVITRETVDKYWETRDNQHRQFKQKMSHSVTVQDG